MKRLLSTLILLCLLIPSLLLADEPIQLARMNPWIAGGVAASPASSCTGANPSDCTFRETFDGENACGDGTHTNCDNTWTSLAGYYDFNYATSPLQGMYSALAVSEVIERIEISAAELTVL